MFQVFTNYFKLDSFKIVLCLKNSGLVNLKPIPIAWPNLSQIYGLISYVFISIRCKYFPTMVPKKLKSEFSG